MNQPYRVRIKTKVKVRIAVILVLTIACSAIAVNYILQLDFGIVPPKHDYGRKYLLKAERVLPSGSYRGSTSYPVGQFKLPNNKLVSSRVYIISHNGFYCITEHLVDGKVRNYQTLKQEDCV